MHKSKYLGDLAQKLAQVSQEADDSGNAELSQKIDVILEDVSNQAQEVAEAMPETPAEETHQATHQATQQVESETEEKEVKIAEAKLSKKQKSSLRGFYRAASRMMDNVSVGRREFPASDVRSAMGKIMASIDSGLDLLEQFSNVVPKKDQIERQASTGQKITTDTNVDSELRLYAALKETMAKEEIVEKGILTSDEVEDLETFANVSAVQISDEMAEKIRELAANGELEKILDMDSQRCPYCKGRIFDGRCSGCGEVTEVDEVVEPVQRSMDY